MAEDPFPRERVAETLRRMPAYARLAWRLARDPLISKARRAAVVAAAGYLVSPVDLVPGVIPVIGQLDDLAFALAALKVALSGLDPARRQVHLASVGLADDDLATDLRTLAATTAWLVRAGARTTGRVARKGGRVAVAAAGSALGAAGRAAPAARAAVAKAAPATKAAAKAGSGARSTVAKGLAAAKGLAGRQPGMKVRVSVRRPPALGPGRAAGVAEADDHLDVEPDGG